MEIDDAVKTFNMKMIPTIGELLEECRKLYLKEVLRDKFCNARNVIIKHVISQQIRDRHFFEIPPVEGVCEKCNGTGELYRFQEKEVDVTCHLCGGSGQRSVKCNRCVDGRYIREMNNGGVKINVKCNYCKGEGTRMVKCHLCRGKGQLKKVVKSEIIKSYNSCSECHGIGFKRIVPPEPPTPTTKEIVEKEVSWLIKQEAKTNMMNPVITPEMRDKLMPLLPA